MASFHAPDPRRERERSRTPPPAKTTPDCWATKNRSEGYIPANERVYECNAKNCNMRFTSFQSRDNHEQRSHPSTNGACVECRYPKCTALFATLGDRIQHENHSHRDEQRLWYCTERGCGGAFYYYEQFQHHNLLHRRSHKCTVAGCRFTAIYQDELERHTRNAHLPSPASRPTAPKEDDAATLKARQERQAAKAARQQREKAEVDKAKAPSETSASTASEEDGFALLTKTSTDSTVPAPKTFKCRFDGCDATFPSMKLRTVHEDDKAVHPEAKPHMCTFAGCTAGFFKVQELKGHLGTHTKANACPVAGCTLRFGTRQGLKKHLEDKHPGVPMPPPPAKVAVAVPAAVTHLADIAPASPSASGSTATTANALSLFGPATAASAYAEADAAAKASAEQAAEKAGQPVPRAWQRLENGGVVCAIPNVKGYAYSIKRNGDDWMVSVLPEGDDDDADSSSSSRA